MSDIFGAPITQHFDPKILETLTAIKDQMGALKTAVEGLKKPAQETGDSFAKGATDMTSFVGQVKAAVQAIPALISELGAGAARAEEHQEALAELGTQYERLTQVTHGAVSAEAASDVQRQLSMAGLHLQGDELIHVSTWARQYARPPGSATRLRTFW